MSSIVADTALSLITLAPELSTNFLAWLVANINILIVSSFNYFSFFTQKIVCPARQVCRPRGGVSPVKMEGDGSARVPYAL
jgi:hypothetical protein